jgi:hypothetical protein
MFFTKHLAYSIVFIPIVLARSSAENMMFFTKHLAYSIVFIPIALVRSSAVSLLLSFQSLHFSLMQLNVLWRPGLCYRKFRDFFFQKNVAKFSSDVPQITTVLHIIFLYRRKYTTCLLLLIGWSTFRIYTSLKNGNSHYILPLEYKL